MNKNCFEEHMIHGTADFPVGIYDMRFEGTGRELFPLHYHNEFEILVITKGRARVQLEDNIFYPEKGEGLFINSGMLHSAVQAENEECCFLAIVFLPDFVASEHEELYKRYIAALIRRELIFAPALPHEAVKLAEEIRLFSEAAKPGYELSIKGNLARILARCMEEAEYRSVSQNAHKTDIIKDTLDYIHCNYGNEIALDDLADHANVSKEHLCRVFKETAHFSPIVYLNRYRIMQSTYMLRSTDKSISEISSCCGFNSSSYFNRLFMRFMKSSPTEFRKCNRN